MSVFGSLFTAVSGLSAQSDSISMISNNIANVNTVGYKKTDASFESLVTTKSNAAAYSPGSVIARQNSRIDQQGILQQSSSPTDIAISGNGFFVVKASTGSLAEPLYTRAGSFSEDSTGILRNSAGYYLYGWPLDQDGELPASQANISSLVPVNVAFLGGLTAPTTSASLGLNLNAAEAQTAYPVPANASVDFTRAIQVFDSLGTGHDLTVHFTKMTSPTATATGNTPLNNVDGNIAGDVGTIANTDTFTIQVNADTPVTVTLDGTVADLLAQLNSVTDDVTGEQVLNAQLDANGNLSIKANRLGDSITMANVSGTPLNSGNLGLASAFVSTDTSTGVDYTTVDSSDTLDNSLGVDTATPSQISVQVGANPPVTIDMDGTLDDLLADIGAVPGISSAAIVNGNLQIVSAQSITLDDVTGSDLALLGFTPGDTVSPTGTINAPPSPDLLTNLDGSKTPSTDGWWEVSFITPTGAIAEKGAINFLSNGALNAVADAGQKVSIDLDNIDWGNGSSRQNITFDISGFTQFAGDYNVVSSVQNGAALGLRTGVSIDDEGYVIAQFSNGQSKAIYRLPIATFANMNGLDAQSGNVFRESDSSGSYNLREAGVGGAGAVASGSLEASNVDLAEEFSKMIVTQRAYSANTKVISAADQMTQDLLQIS